jgi:hypothetical protein
MNFWAQFYITAKYGFEAEYLASAQNLFEKAEAELAIRHAEECSLAATIVPTRNLDRRANSLWQGASNNVTCART